MARAFCALRRRVLFEFLKLLFMGHWVCRGGARAAEYVPRRTRRVYIYVRVRPRPPGDRL